MNKFTLPLFLILTFFTNYQSVISKSLSSAEDEIIIPFTKIKQGSYVVSLVADGKTIQVERIVKK